MMGRLNRDQKQLFYSFRLRDVVPDDHLVRAIAAVDFTFDKQRNDCCNSVVRMPPDKFNDPGKMRCHRSAS
jgi:hypothetical protein